MYRIISKLLMYGSMPRDSILMQMGDICRQMDQGTQDKEELLTRTFAQVKRILILGTDYGFDRNLWHNYLSYLLINQFSHLLIKKCLLQFGSVQSLSRV